METVRTKRNGVIELLRFLFAMMIVLHHDRYIGGGSENALYASFGYIGVEFFFIVSGFLMARSAACKSDLPEIGLGRETGSFVWRKIKAILLYYVLAALTSLISDGLIEPKELQEAATGIWDLIFLGMSGIKTYPVVNASWYLSAMFLAMLFLYPLLRKFKDKFIYIIAPLLAILFLGYISKTYGNLNQYSNDYAWIYTGLMRAIAEISIGCICYEITERIRKKKLTTLSRALISIVSIIGIATIFIWADRGSEDGLDFVLLFAIAVVTTLVFSGLGLFTNSRLFQSPVFPWLGKFSLVLYLNHMWVKTVITNILPESMGYERLLTIFIVCSMIVSLLMMFLSYGLRKLWSVYGKNIKGIFIKNSQ